MENPFIIPWNASQGHSASLNNSRAITSVLGLTPDTYGVEVFEVSDDSPSSQTFIVGLETLAPTCPGAPLLSADFYPSPIN